ncbi:hypothetical protein G7B40_039985 [Aetokthonos hydrillicola Thurmond2011]|uniref:Uncharacterized protein n=1 Tax=Aetokthonos hydrillicola Thurmond2011 TaxID=2712845 RepID=A0AAP5IHE3_9CYAN|nr:hypothetical protein [Aetokthonos hydrillicola]MBW4590097.1 hypothetical protein [Aetokthonos hydrillicola CCALA 1050]MDR9900672.1 hypothetical protein [Aetokthonos hydrillicola Thurmond2011]
MQNVKSRLLTLVFLAMLNTSNVHQKVAYIVPYFQVVALVVATVNNSLQIARQLKPVTKGKR